MLHDPSGEKQIDVGGLRPIMKEPSISNDLFKSNSFMYLSVEQEVRIFSVGWKAMLVTELRLDRITPNDLYEFKSNNRIVLSSLHVPIKL